MGTFATTAALFFLALLLLGAAAFVVAWLAARLARRRALEDARRRRRAWGGRDYDRVRTKYFDKERRARTARARTRFHQEPQPYPREEESAPQPVSDLEYFHRQTLGLGGEELTAETLRLAYKQRIREYHPDRVAPLGEKLRLLAEEETKRINEAYKFLRARYEH